MQVLFSLKLCHSVWRTLNIYLSWHIANRKRYLQWKHSWNVTFLSINRRQLFKILWHCCWFLTELHEVGPCVSSYSVYFLRSINVARLTVHCSVTDSCFRFIILCFASSCSESEMSKYLTASHVLSVTLWEGLRLWNANLLPRRMLSRLQKPRSKMVLITITMSVSEIENTDQQWVQNYRIDQTSV